MPWRTVRKNVEFLAELEKIDKESIKKKSDEVAEKENERFGQFVGKQATELRLELGAPTEDFINELGNEILVYKTKKYGIPCKRQFEINATGVIVGFTSSGCI